MNDPRVESLEYRLETDPTTVFESPPPLEHDTLDFDLRLQDGRLLVRMKRDCATVDEARAVVGPFLRAWEVHEAMDRGGREELHFMFETATVIDRRPVPGELSPALLAATGTVRLTAPYAVLTVSRRSYPPPPENFAFSPDLETLWNRYQGYKLGREPLPTMGYFCLTVIEATYQGRANAGQALNVDLTVLNKLGELTSTRGDKTEARKQKDKPLQPFTPAERRWIDETLRKMIRYLAAATAGRPVVGYPHDGRSAAAVRRRLYP